MLDMNVCLESTAHCIQYKHTVTGQRWKSQAESPQRIQRMESRFTQRRVGRKLVDLVESSSGDGRSVGMESTNEH